MEKFDPLSNDWLLNKFNYYSELRDADQLYWSNMYNMYVITRYDDVLFALSNPDIFSSAKGNLLREIPTRFGKTLGSSDNPQHDKLKEILKSAYSKDNIDRILSVVNLKIEKFLKDTTIHVSNLAEEIAAWIVTEILNLPCNKDDMQSLILTTFRTSNKALDTNNNVTDETSLITFMQLVRDLVSSKTDPLGPGVYAEVFKLETDFNLHNFTTPLFAGMSSMTGALEYLTLDIVSILDQLQSNYSLIPSAVNESLRFNTATARFARRVLKEVTVQGTVIKPGTRVVLCLDSANRDPSKFTNPDVFDITRTTPNLGFGFGLHSCIALAISKAVMIQYLSMLLTHAGKYKVVTDRAGYQFVLTAPGNFDMISNIIIEKINGGLAQLGER